MHINKTLFSLKRQEAFIRINMVSQRIHKVSGEIYFEYICTWTFSVRKGIVVTLTLASVSWRYN